ncbi:MAG: cyclic nucleotide-binding domain-containing protein [Rhodospirillales bacterium]
MSATGVLERKMYQAGDRNFKEGDEGLFAYLVQSGSVEIYREVSGEVLSTIGSGGIFGEMALIDGKPRAASARAAGG